MQAATSTAASSLSTAIYVILAILSGALLPIQSGINITLLEPLNSPFAPSSISGLVGAIFLTFLWPWDPRPAQRRRQATKLAFQQKQKDDAESPSADAVSGSGSFPGETMPYPDAVPINNPESIEDASPVPIAIPSASAIIQVPSSEAPVEMTLWERLKKTEKYLFIVPGFFGIYYAVLSVLIAKKIGFSVFFIAIVAGQMIGATVVDHFGWFGLPKKRITTFRVLTMIIALIGAVMSVIEKLTSSSNTDVPVWKEIIFILMSFLAGISVSVQVSMAVLLSKRLKSLPHRISWGTMVLAAMLVVTVCGLAAAISPDKYFVDFKALKGLRGWHFTGGLLSAVYLVASLILGPKLGLTVFVVLAVAGQLLSSLLIDSFGLIGNAKIGATVLRVCGVLIVFLSVMAFRFEDRLQFMMCWIKKEVPVDPLLAVPDEGLQKLFQLEFGQATKIVKVKRPAEKTVIRTSVLSF